MKNILAAVTCLLMTALVSSTSKATRRTGYWQVTQVPAYDWVDWVETVYSDVGEYVWGDINTGDYGARGEYITSGFAGYRPGAFSLQSRSEGPIRIKFEWIGEEPVPESISYEYWTEAIAGVSGLPGSWTIDSYYVAVDGELGVSYSGTGYFYVIATGAKTHGVVTGGSSVVYANPPGFVNNFAATCTYDCSGVYTESAYAVTVLP